MTLENYISEAISSKKNTPSTYTPMPKKRTDKDGLVKWLLENGYVQIQGSLVEDLLREFNTNGNRCFYVAPHENGNPLSHWIRFFDGNNTYCIRTIKDVPRDFKDCSIITDSNKTSKNYDPMSKWIDYKDIVEYFKGKQLD